MAGTLSAAQALPLISQYESNNQDVLNSSGPGGTAASTASGYYQIINGTWSQYAAQVPGASQYPTAMSAPADVQAQVATAIYNAQGIAPWQSNTNLMTAFYGAAGTAPDSVTGDTSSGSLASGGTSQAAPSGLMASVWEIVMRGGLLLLGGLLCLLALAALLFKSATTAVPVKALAL